MPLQKYNVTSAYGCYKTGKKGDSGIDGSVHFNPKDKKLGPYGCQFKWQAEEGAVIHDTSKGVTATQGLAEKQITVLLLEGASKIMATSLGAILVSIYML